MLYHNAEKPKSNLLEALLRDKQEALADGQEGMLALRDALERTADATRGLLERAEAAANEAEGGEVSSLRSGGRLVVAFTRQQSERWLPFEAKTVRPACIVLVVRKRFVELVPKLPQAHEQGAAWQVVSPVVPNRSRSSRVCREPFGGLQARL